MATLKYYSETYDFSPTGGGYSDLYGSNLSITPTNRYINIYDGNDLMYPSRDNLALCGIPNKGYLGGFIEYKFTEVSGDIAGSKIGHIGFKLYNEPSGLISYPLRPNNKICDVYNSEQYINSVLAGIGNSRLVKFDFYSNASGYIPYFAIENPLVYLKLNRLKVHNYVYNY